MTTAEALRDQGMQAAECAADPRVILHVDAVIESYVLSGMPFSANDIRDSVPVTSQGLVGARVKSASMRKDSPMVKVGSTRSTLPNTHAKEIAVWQGVASR